MNLDELMEKLSGLELLRKELENEIGVFSNIYYISGCHVWDIKMYKSTAQIMKDEFIYWRQFDTIEDMVSGMEFMILGAKISRDEEV